MIVWLLIGAGGAIGAVSRYALSGWVQGRSAGTFPWGTMVVNVLGCLVMAVLAQILFERSVLRPEYRTAILIGVLGAFTTFSTFGYETISLLNNRQFPAATAYVLLTNAGCLIAAWIGYHVTERIIT